MVLGSMDRIKTCPNWPIILISRSIAGGGFTVRPGRLLTRATQKIESGTLSLGSDEYRKHKRNQDQATRQLDLLRNDLGGTIERIVRVLPLSLSGLRRLPARL